MCWTDRSVFGIRPKIYKTVCKTQVSYKVCNFSPVWYFIYDNCKTKFRECFFVKVGCLLMILSRNECQHQ